MIIWRPKRDVYETSFKYDDITSKHTHIWSLFGEVITTSRQKRLSNFFSETLISICTIQYFMHFHIKMPCASYFNKNFIMVRIILFLHILLGAKFNVLKVWTNKQFACCANPLLPVHLLSQWTLRVHLRPIDSWHVRAA